MSHSDIDIIGLFDQEDIVNFMGHIADEIPDPVLRCGFLDLMGETCALEQYTYWAFDCGRAAISCSDKERERFYEDLLNAALI